MKSISLAIFEGQTKVLLTVTKGIQAALKYMHEQNIAHNDVSVKNIIMVNNGKQMRAVLIDYGIASSLGSKIVGFQGTTEVAHREIHSNSSAWCPVGQYDFTSLAYTLIIIKQGRIP
jgi:serine/threonine protein kinase